MFISSWTKRVQLWLPYNTPFQILQHEIIYILDRRTQSLLAQK
jgi:hypothetical protein